MSNNPSFAPIIRRVKFGGVMFENVRYSDEALAEYEDQEVLLDMEIDVRSEMRSFRVYDMWENEICLIDIDRVDSIGEAAHG
ncbi:MAG: hypothetical protein M0P91_05325 [Sulfuricurvum sp.]|jgi:hypothetical protein|uniref:Mu transposase C-terminal domain-containing protein n=1 Tax=Sulfuricurvum sp. TaxID=2025608 RepID=UPI0025F05C49|nr:Mu transposase C-terminal domain-containing protein [Sulfuricurvum sp.]MCK9372597.1 hypothetical protein [Sulfuricurvum sp.]